MDGGRIEKKLTHVDAGGATLEAEIVRVQGALHANVHAMPSCMHTCIQRMRMGIACVRDGVHMCAQTMHGV